VKSAQSADKFTQKEFLMTPSRFDHFFRNQVTAGQTKIAMLILDGLGSRRRLPAP
jgi:hypothetical protein